MVVEMNFDEKNGGFNDKNKIKTINPPSLIKEKFYIDEETGERVRAQTIIKNTNRNGFEITYLAYLYDLFESLGNKKMKVFSYILENKNSDNQLIITMKELAEKTKVAYSTVSETLFILEEKGLIKRRIGSLMVIPKIAHKGDKGREKNLMIKFKEFD